MSFFLLAVILVSTFLIYLVWGGREERRLTRRRAFWLALAVAVILLWTLTAAVLDGQIRVR